MTRRRWIGSDIEIWAVINVQKQVILGMFFSEAGAKNFAGKWTELAIVKATAKFKMPKGGKA